MHGWVTGEYSCSPISPTTGDSVIDSELVEEYQANALFSAYQDDLRFGCWLLVDEPKMPRGMRERNAHMGNNALNAKRYMHKRPGGEMVSFFDEIHALSINERNWEYLENIQKQEDYAL